MADIRRDEGSFPTADNLKLFWISASPPEPRAHIALVHGYAEHIGRYAHVPGGEEIANVIFVVTYVLTAILVSSAFTQLIRATGGCVSHTSLYKS